MRQLECYVAVAEELSFRRAAKRLSMAQSSLSKQVQNLEGALGFTLLDRDTHSVTLTKAGQLYLHRVRHLLHQLERAAIDARMIHQGRGGVVRLGFIDSIHGHDLPDLLVKLKASLPDLSFETFEMGPTDQIEALGNHEIDIGFVGMIENSFGDGYERFEFREYPLAVAIEESHPLADYPSLTLRQLADETFLFSEARNAPAYNGWIQHLLLSAGVEPVMEELKGRASTVFQQVALGRGVAVFPQPVLQKATRTIRVLPITGVPMFPTHLIIRKDEEEAIIRTVFDAALGFGKSDRHGT